MSLSLLAPGALVLAVLVGLPIVAHLTKQRPTDRVAFGAMLLVRRLVKRLRRRRSLKDLLLMVLRVLAVLLAVLAATAPRLSWQGDVPEFGGSGRVVLVVDTSMSMALLDGGGTLLARATADAARRVQDMPDGSRVGLVAFDRTSRALTPELTDDKGRVLAALATLEPSIHGGDLRAALLDARRLLGGEAGEIVLFSDEAGPVMIPAASEELARIIESGSAVVPAPVLANPPRNLAVVQATYGDGIEGGQLTFRVHNYGPDRLEVPCEVTLPDGAQIPVFVDVPPDGEAEARVTVPREAKGGVGEVHCDDPDLKSDDRRWFHLPQVGASRVLVVDGDPGDTPTRSEVYFLERALAPWGGAKAGVTPDIVSPNGLTALDPGTHKLVVLANVSDPRPFGPAMRDFVRKGGSVVLGVGDNVTADRYNVALGGVLPSAFRKSVALADRAEPPVMLELPDTSFDLFTPFSRGGRTSFTRVGAWRVMSLEPYADGGDVTTLLRYRGGVPALVERRVGKGRVIVWTSTFDYAWTNLPLEAAFMPLMQRLSAYLGGESGGGVVRLDALVGDRVQVPLEEGVHDAVVVGPKGVPARSHVEGSHVVFEPDEPGAYAVQITDGPVTAWVAVNVDAVESDVRRIHSVAATEAELDPELFTRHEPLAGKALAAAFGLMVLSAFLALVGGLP